MLGTELAKIKNLFLATEGFNGVGDLVGKNFCEEQEIRDKGKPPNVYHIIPTKDSSVSFYINAFIKVKILY